MARLSGTLLGGGGGSGGGLSEETLAAAGNGMGFWRDGVPFAHIPRAVFPLFITNPSGMMGAPRFVTAPPQRMGPIWRPDADYEPQRVTGQTAGDQAIEMCPYRRYVVDRVDIVDLIGNPVGGALKFGVYAKEGGAGGGGIEVLPPTTDLSGMTDDIRSRKTFSGLNGGQGIDLEAPHLYLNVVTPNATPISFVLLFHGTVIMPCDE